MRLKPLGTFVVLALTIAAVTVVAMPSIAGGGGAGKSKLSKADRALLTEQRAAGAGSATVLIATTEGQTAAVARSIEALGGTIAYRDSDLGYLRVSIAFDKTDAVGKLGGIDAIDADQLLPLPSPSPEATGIDTPALPPGPTTPGSNPYMPTRDTGAQQFAAANPTYDGRGVVIGVVDTGVDLLTPELQSAKAIDGTSVPKFTDWVTGTDPVTDGDPTWLNMSTSVKAAGGTFAVGTSTYTAPRTGSFRFAQLNEASLGAGSEYGIGCGSDLNRDGVCGQKFSVLWDGAETVWVDTDLDNSFADEKAMSPFKQHGDVATFGTDNSSTAIRESVPFVVQIEKSLGYVNIGIVSGAHGTHVTGIAAGKGFFGGAFNGAAPEAQIVALRACMFVSGCTAHALFEGMIYVAKTAKADVINMSIGGLPALNDANNARAVLYDRLITHEKVQMFISAGNSGPGLNTIGDPSVATNVMSVAAYAHADTWHENYGAHAAKIDGMFVFSSRGPREDGGFKPNISAPGAAVSTVPAWQPGQPVAGTYALPPGYAMFNGTSMAAPQATGAAALLISAAKQTGAQHEPDQLRQAINSSATYLPYYGAHEQGNGVMNVGAAWNLLKQNIKTVSISSTAPVNTVLSGLLATANSGPGIYEREGLAPGASGTRTILLTRNSGGSATYNLSLVGNDGSFSLGSTSVTLSGNTPTPVSLSFGPLGAGVHSVILNVDDPSTVGIDYQTMNTLVAAHQFNAVNNFSVTTSGTADRPDRAAPTFFYYVPAGTPAFKVDVSATAGRIRVLRQHPWGVPFDNTNTTPYCTAPCSFSRTVSSPTAGVWEVTVDNSRVAAATPATFTVTASILGVAVNPTSWTVNGATAGTPYTQPFTFTNNYGAFTGGAVGTALGSAISSTPTIANGAQNITTVSVPAGTTSLTATIGGTSDASADLDLFVFNPSNGLAGSNADGDSEETVTIANPAAGTWTILVDGYAVPAGTTSYNYLDVFAHGSFGTIAISDPPALHGNGSTWGATASVTPLALPTAGRYLRGFVNVTSGGNVLGSAPVRLNP